LAEFDQPPTGELLQAVTVSTNVLLGFVAGAVGVPLSGTPSAAAVARST